MNMSGRAMPSSSKDAASSAESVHLRNRDLLRALVKKNACIARLQKDAAKQNRDLSSVASADNSAPASAPRQLRLRAKAKPQPPAPEEEEWYGRYSDSRSPGSPKRSVTPDPPKKRRKHTEPRASKARGV